MNDQHLSESLRRLPEARAGAGFTARVLARLDEAAPRPEADAAGGWPRLVAVAAAAGGVVLLLSVGVWDPRPAAVPVGRPDAAPAAVPRAATAPEPDGLDAPADPAAAPRIARRAPAPRPTAAPQRSRPAASARTADGPPAGGAIPAATAAARLAELRAEHDRLAARLAALRADLPPDRPPVVLLGGSDDFELVLDLGRTAPGAGDAGLRPAASPGATLPRHL